MGPPEPGPMPQLQTIGAVESPSRILGATWMETLLLPLGGLCTVHSCLIFVGAGGQGHGLESRAPLYRPGSPVSDIDKQAVFDMKRPRPASRPEPSHPVPRASKVAFTEQEPKDESGGARRGGLSELRSALSALLDEDPDWQLMWPRRTESADGMLVLARRSFLLRPKEVPRGATSAP